MLEIPPESNLLLENALKQNIFLLFIFSSFSLSIWKLLQLIQRAFISSFAFIILLHKFLLNFLLIFFLREIC